MDVPSAHSVVVGIDGSEPALRALRWATEEAARRSVELHIVHSWSTPVLETRRRRTAEHGLTDAQEFLERSARQAQREHGGLIVTWQTTTDDPVDTLVGLSGFVDLLVVGARGLNRFSALLLGSVSQRLAAHAACPVVVVRDRSAAAPAGAAAEPGAGAVVLGAAPGEPAGPVEFAFAEAARWEVPLRVVRTWMWYPEEYSEYAPVPPDELTPPEVDQRMAAERRELAQVLASAQAGYPDVSIIEDIALALPEETLVEHSRRARLVVVGARRQRRALAMPLGAVTQRVLHHADCPVAVVPC